MNLLPFLATTTICLLATWIICSLAFSSHRADERAIKIIPPEHMRQVCSCGAIQAGPHADKWVRPIAFKPRSNDSTTICPACQEIYRSQLRATYLAR